MAWTVSDIPNLAGVTAVVTGANGGLGYETTLVMAARGAHVVMAVRDLDRGASARARILADHPSASLEIVHLDLASLASVRQAGESIAARHPRLGILVNNAGVMAIPCARSMDGHEMQLAVSHLGHFALTSSLLPSLVRSGAGRVVNLTSTGRLLGSTMDSSEATVSERYDPWLAYGRAKLATAQFTVELEARLRAAGAPVRAVAADPGFSYTDLQARSAREAGGRTQRLAHAAVARFGTNSSLGALPQLRAATDPGAIGGALYALAFLVAGPPVRHPYLSPWMRRQDRHRMWAFSEAATRVPFDVAAAARAG